MLRSGVHQWPGAGVCGAHSKLLPVLTRGLLHLHSLLWSPGKHFRAADLSCAPICLGLA